MTFSFFFSAEELSQTPEASPELTKRSWFGSLMSTDRDETYTIIVKEKPLASIKADLVQAFLSVSFFYSLHYTKGLFVVMMADSNVTPVPKS